MSLSVFFSWWGRQLLSFAPDRIKNTPFFPVRPVIHAVWQENALLVQLMRRNVTTVLGTLSGDVIQDRTTAIACDEALSGATQQYKLILRLPSGLFLNRNIILPLATEHDLASVLHYEMDRLTPFSAEEIYYSHRVVRRDAALNQIELTLSVVPRKPLAPIMERLSVLGRTVQALENSGRSYRIQLGNASPFWRRIGWKRAVAGGFSLLVIPALILALFWQQSTRLAALDARITMLRPTTMEASTLRNIIEDQQDNEHLLHDARLRYGNSIAILAALTKAVPDSGFLTDLSLRQGQILISGQAVEPTALIQTLASLPLFHNPAFIAPITRLSGQSGSLFSIRAELSR